MFSSTVIPTVGRPTLERAVASVLAQDLAPGEFEIIVVNDSGRPLPIAPWHASPQVHLVDANRRERSVARNVGAALARGRYLHFLDDDDWMAPGGLRRLTHLAQASQAQWLYGGAQLVKRQGQALIKLQPDLAGNCFVQTMAGEWIPLQASLIESSLYFKVGGFNPRITGPEDNDLLRRVAFRGLVAGTSELVAYISWGQTGSTTPHARHSSDSRWARERILQLAGVFTRLRTSAPSGYWRGRMARVYLTSVIWNLQHGRPLTAASRGLFALAALSLAGPDLLSVHFWRTLAQPHASLTFRRGKAQSLDEAAIHLSRD